MKNTVLLCCLLVVSALKTYASDLLVEEFALAPSYSSIGAAVAAATNGDRIIIKNRNGNAPWIENVTVNKSLQFLPYTNDTFFVVQGNYIITPADNREIVFIGMNNLVGGISATTVGNAAARTKVSIMGCWLQSGSIAFAQIGYNINTVHTKLNAGSVAFRSGSLIGCDITIATSGSAVNITGETVVTSDVIKVIANKITSLGTTTAGFGINWSSASHFLDIRNNLIYVRNSGIAISKCRALNTVTNKLNNNTVSINGALVSANVYGINITAASANSIFEVMNNLIDLSSTSTVNVYGINNVSTLPNITLIYNTIDDSIAVARRTSGSFSTNSNNTFTTVGLTANGNIIGNGGINAGNPAAPYYDLDLSINDCGAYGGGYSLTNYFPIHAGSARVYMVTVPANVRVGGTISIQADGYDR